MKAGPPLSSYDPNTHEPAIAAVQSRQGTMTCSFHGPRVRCAVGYIRVPRSFPLLVVSSFPAGRGSSVPSPFYMSLSCVMTFVIVPGNSVLSCCRAAGVLTEDTACFHVRISRHQKATGRPNDTRFFFRCCSLCWERACESMRLARTVNVNCVM